MQARRIASLVSALVVTALAAPAAAQIGGPIGGGTGQGTIGGVYIDTEGMVRVRANADPARFAAARAAARAPNGDAQPDQLVYISLPRLFAAVQAKLDAGEPLPDDMRYLRGMTRLRYVFLFPEEHDLVIAGPAEPADPQASEPGRPLGQHTGRPLLRLDDLVTALRTVGPAPGSDRNPNKSFGCSIDLTQQQLNDMVAEARNWGAIRPSQRSAMAAALAKAVGPQKVRVIGVEPNTSFAFVCVEADYLLKRLSLGLDRPPVPRLSSALALATSDDGIYHRFWFESRNEPILVTPDGASFEVTGQRVQVKATGTIDRNAPDAGQGSQRFAERFTEHFPALAERIPAFADLQNITDLGLLAALIDADDLHSRANWDLAWLLDSSRYPMQPVAVPRTAAPLVNYQPRTGRTAFAVGGVLMQPALAVQPDNRRPTPSEGLDAVRTRPADDQWFEIK